MKQTNSITAEERFHDAWADCVDPDSVLVDECFEACTAPENRYIIRELGDIRGKRVLELGCGAGEASIYLAKKGAVVTASDLSRGMLGVTREVANRHRVQIQMLQCSAERLPCSEGSFDIVYAANVLHHSDVEATLREARRVLRPGGMFVSWDPLAHNPLINIYRRMASRVRTAEEHPLVIGHLALFRRHFSDVRFTTTWLFTLWIFVSFYLHGVDPNRERYWKKIIVDYRALGPLYCRLERLDMVVLRCLPWLKRYCWNLVVVAGKRDDVQRSTTA